MNQKTLKVMSKDRRRLEAIVADPTSPQKHVWRCRIILSTADGHGMMATVRAVGKSKITVRRWLDRYRHEGVDGLLRDKSRPPGTPKTSDEKVAEVIALTQQPPPHEATHWTARAMAKAVGLAASTVHAIWKQFGFTPHRFRFFKVSTDGQFVEKTKDVVGLYQNPPDNAVVLSADEKSQIQALDRTQPGLPIKPGKDQTLTGDYKRHGTTSLFATLNTLTGKVIGQNMRRHRHQEFIRFLNKVERAIPPHLKIHMILDNYGTHDCKETRKWLERHKRWTFHFTPTSCSWMNAVEGFFAKLERRRLKHGVFRSVAELEAAIERFIEEHNEHEAKPFVWNADPDEIIAARNRGYQKLESMA